MQLVLLTAFAATAATRVAAARRAGTTTAYQARAGTCATGVPIAGAAGGRGAAAEEIAVLGFGFTFGLGAVG